VKPVFLSLLTLLALPALAAPTGLNPLDRDQLVRLDPALAAADDARVRTHKIGVLDIVRVTPIVDGARVEGADRVIVKKHGEIVRTRGDRPLNKLSGFDVSEGWATVAATNSVRGSLIQDATVERASGLARRVWLSTDSGLRAAWRVRVPTWRLRDLSDVWVDAQTGEVLKRLAVARFQDAGPDGGLDGGVDVDGGDVDPPPADAGPLPPAPDQAGVFVYSPVAPLDPDAVQTVTLPNLRNANVGDHLRGDYVETFNCCKEYVCLDGSSECPLAGRRCAEADDVNPIESTIRIQIPTQGFNSPIPLPETLHAQAVFCSELPRLRSEDDGWFPTPVDKTPEEDALLGAASEVDVFAEVQAYYSSMEFFAFMRDTLDDQTYCLADSSMRCEADGSPTLSGGEPELPFHIAVNILIPEIDVQLLVQQLIGGRGADEGNPILVENYQRLDNAAFIPALESGPVDIPPEFQDLAEQFNRPFDSNVYFQGVRDFAYDGDIVFHEFMHAVTYSFLPDLGSFNKSEFGVTAEGGALNEGWSDYFAASFLNDPEIAEYGAEGLPGGNEIALRSTDNTKACPLDMNGEVHDDSEPWSGALWQIREDTVDAGDIATFDRALLSALAEAGNDEDFEAAAERVLGAMDDFSVGDSAAARTIFEERGIIGCDYSYPLATLNGAELLTEPKERLFVVSPGDANLAAVAPSAVQFRVELPPGTPSFTLRWTQQAPATDFIGGDPERLRVLVAEQDSAITWRYDGTDNRFATPVDADGNDILLDLNDTSNEVVPGEPDNAGVAAATFTTDVTPDPCNARTFHAQLMSTDGTAVLSDINVEFGDAQGECDDNPNDAGPGGDPPDDCACSSSGDGDASEPTGIAAALALLGLVAVRRRRRR
jgi:MYXO-CTERM domain-containing protein